MPKLKGQIKRLSIGNWQIRIQTRGLDGKRKSKSFSGYESREKAQDALDTLIVEIAKAKKLPRIERRTFKQLFDDYLEFIKPDLREQTFNSYEGII
ncbi:MAG TPA: Arm DNA-binding domain-containing protein, partial [Sphingobacteriaceae bacterium]